MKRFSMQFYRNTDCICKINEWFSEYWSVDDVWMIKIKENLNKNSVEILRHFMHICSTSQIFKHEYLILYF